MHPTASLVSCLRCSTCATTCGCKSCRAVKPMRRTPSSIMLAWNRSAFTRSIPETTSGLPSNLRHCPASK
ncbi:hypothetical protein [Lysobacter gummosus]|uniref:hypothetical protein n=1 Tax=Lysobacter gummosus TaxID=262324 RepID=UPI0036329A5A